MSSFSSFVFSRTPRVIFGAGSSERIAETLATFGRRILLVVGNSSLRASGRFAAIEEQGRSHGLCLHTVVVQHEPSPDLVDTTVAEYAGHSIDAVCSIGGGSAIDAGKAISAMLPLGGSVVDYLETIGSRSHPGIKVPFVAVPTTAGTGSEATKNAVLSRVGSGGFKRSLRHESFVPDVAIVDPTLSVSCPPTITAACGMDAFTQLLESYVSPAASPVTDALAVSGIEHVAEALMPLCTNRSNDINLRTAMSYAALISGITLANAGLGVVHSLAATIGGMVAIPHGVACGALLLACTKNNIRILKQTSARDHPALVKYARIGALLCGVREVDVNFSCRSLIDTIGDWISRLRIPRLSDYGITQKDISLIVQNTVVKNNCTALSTDDLNSIVSESI